MKLSIEVGEEVFGGLTVWRYSVVREEPKPQMRCTGERLTQEDAISVALDEAATLSEAR